MPREKKARFGKFERWTAAGMLPLLFVPIPPLPTETHFANCQLFELSGCMHVLHLLLETVSDGTDERNRKRETLGYGEASRNPPCSVVLTTAAVLPKRSGKRRAKGMHPCRVQPGHFWDRQSLDRTQDRKPLATHEMEHPLAVTQATGNSSQKLPLSLR